MTPNGKKRRKPSETTIPWMTNSLSRLLRGGKSPAPLIGMETGSSLTGAAPAGGAVGGKALASIAFVRSRVKVP